mmetsp:Transcript_14808/g.35087  ORF Transcript_14808/g.35087 Transcript_14808/m.35087 type:complete len:129 (-) Transcript_14808:86-472(-)|eukprot:CAMPEP_0181487878 /NCGR_PEP_ID=MMETSP1110-20121109/48063_1 /TAXON_ID=174948 /ORGANISM="Symbiodinium sp., Strain CCMP421" /LENGTH=128 /DNA_ID=CAMNT_0023614433 /DNA_START=53 /DNA_END=439 /DNA_ORIENTATION=+
MTSFMRSLDQPSSPRSTMPPPRRPACEVDRDVMKAVRYCAAVCTQAYTQVCVLLTALVLLFFGTVECAECESHCDFKDFDAPREDADLSFEATSGAELEVQDLEGTEGAPEGLRENLRLAAWLVLLAF